MCVLTAKSTSTKYSTLKQQKDNWRLFPLGFYLLGYLDVWHLDDVVIVDISQEYLTIVQSFCRDTYIYYKKTWCKLVACIQLLIPQLMFVTGPSPLIKKKRKNSFLEAAPFFKKKTKTKQSILLDDLIRKMLMWSMFSPHIPRKSSNSLNLVCVHRYSAYRTFIEDWSH